MSEMAAMTTTERTNADTARAVGKAARRTVARGKPPNGAAPIAGHAEIRRASPS